MPHETTGRRTGPLPYTILGLPIIAQSVTCQASAILHPSRAIVEILASRDRRLTAAMSWQTGR